MKKIIAAVLFSSCIFLAPSIHAKDKIDREQAKRELNEIIDSASEKISRGVESAGNSIKREIDSAARKTQEDAVEKAVDKTKEKAEEIGARINDAIKTGVKKTEEALNSHSTKFLTGVLYVKGSGKKMTVTFKADDGTTYAVKTLSSSEDSMLRLSAYHKRRVKISGVLNTETKVITIATYRLAGDKD